MGWVTLTFVGGALAVLLSALAIDVWDRRHGRDPVQRAQHTRSRAEARRQVRTESSMRRIGGRGQIEDQFRAPPDDHDIRPDRRRHH